MTQCLGRWIERSCDASEELNNSERKLFIPDVEHVTCRQAYISQLTLITVFTPGLFFRGLTFFTDHCKKLSSNSIFISFLNSSLHNVSANQVQEIINHIYFNCCFWVIYFCNVSSVECPCKCDFVSS